MAARARSVWPRLAADRRRGPGGHGATGRCRALPVFRNGDAPAAERPPRLLFEGAVSGSGRTADWDEARALAEASEVILAGGLDAQNVAAAIRAVRPWGVDVSSGVERRRGEKDAGKIKEFVARARALEGR